MADTKLKKLPFFHIGQKVSEERKKLYLTKKYPKMCEILGKQDTRSIWYSRSHIEKLLDEIDHAEGSGLRIHLGTYEPGHDFEGQVCLIMNPTRRNEELKDIDVILEDEPDYELRVNLTGEQSIARATELESFNFGFPCPPRCHGED